MLVLMRQDIPLEEVTAYRLGTLGAYEFIRLGMYHIEQVVHSAPLTVAPSYMASGVDFIDAAIGAIFRHLGNSSAM
jgi:hypothetical protein